MRGRLCRRWRRGGKGAESCAAWETASGGVWVRNLISHSTDNALMAVFSRVPMGFWFLIALLALCAGGKVILYDTLDPDCFWHLRVADQLCRDGIGPLVDRVSFASEKEAWTPYSWLGELGMKVVWDAGGYRAAILAQAVMSALFVVLIALGAIYGTEREAARERNGFLGVVIATAGAVFLSLAYLSFRPATLAIVLLAVCYLLIERERAKGERTRWVRLIVPVTALLANVHLFVFLVPLWVGAIWIAAVVKRRPGAVRWAKLLVLTCAATLATPMLPGMIRTLVHYQFDDPMVASGLIAEMQPFWWGSMGVVSAVLAGGFFVLVVLNWRRLDLADGLLLGGATALLLLHGRYAPLFAMVAGPVAARVLAGLSDVPLRRPWVEWALGVILIVGVVRIAFAFPSGNVALGTWLNRHGVETPGYPVAAADFVRRQIPVRTGRVINEFTWGGYLEWRLGDRYQVFLDGRTQVFSKAFWQATYLGTGEEVQACLAGQEADAAILPVAKSRFADSLLKLGWREIYRDERARVLVKAGGPSGRGAEVRISWGPGGD